MVRKYFIGNIPPVIENIAITRLAIFTYLSGRQVKTGNMKPDEFKPFCWSKELSQIISE
jgi:hypothetical protein